MEKQIFLPSMEKKKLERDFKTSRPTVWAALNYTTNSKFAKMLRAAALQRGGVIYGDKVAPPWYMPVCESHKIGDRIYTQTFGDKVHLTLNWVTGLVVLKANGEEINRWDNPLLSDIATIQLNALELSKSIK